MRETILYIASSLDAYIAREDGDVKWLEEFPNPEQTDYGYASLLAGCDTLVMGSATYREVLSFGIEWPYADKDVYVMSKHADLEIKTPRTARLADMDDWLRLKDGLPDNGKNCWLVGGGHLIRSFLQNSAIDRIMLTQFPILLGAGIPLFPPGFPLQYWHLLKCQNFASGAVGLELVPAPLET